MFSAEERLVVETDTEEFVAHVSWVSFTPADGVLREGIICNMGEKEQKKLFVQKIRQKRVKADYVVDPNTDPEMFLALRKRFYKKNKTIGHISLRTKLRDEFKLVKGGGPLKKRK